MKNLSPKAKGIVFLTDYEIFGERKKISYSINQNNIIEDIDLAFKLTFFNKCDEMERPILSEYYQRCFGRELIKVEKSVDA